MNNNELSDIQSESGVIGTLICHPEFILHSDYLLPSYFFGTENGCVYWSIQELYKDGIKNIDDFNIANKMQSHSGVMKTLDKYNLPSIHNFLNDCKSVARHSLEEYKMLAEKIVCLAFKRDLLKTLNGIENDCYNKDFTLDKLSQNTYGELEKLTQKYVMTTEVNLLGEDIDNIWAEIVNRRNDDGTCGIPSKYPLFNEYFTYEEGELVVVQARLKRGKSMLLLNEVVHKLMNGVPTLVVDTELSTRSYVERLIGHITGIKIKNVKNGQYSDEDAIKIKKCIEWIKKQPFVHINDPSITDEKLYTLCKMLKYKMGLQFVVFDYIKSNETSTGDNYNVLGAKCDFLKNQIASDLKLAVLSACQLNRLGEVADSDKINRYLSVGIKWDFKTQEMIAKDGVQCGNAFAKVYVNRNGEQMMPDDDNDYIDFIFSGANATILEAEQHERAEFF